MPRSQVPLFALEPPESDEAEALSVAARATVDALRLQHAIQPWHELDCVMVLQLAKDVGQARGIAKSQMYAQLLQARARLPEPVVAELNDDVVVYEAARDLAWAQAHGYPAALPDAADSHPVV